MKQRLLLWLLLTSPLPLCGQTSDVPFVGCPSDGQIGPLSAPKGKAQQIQIAPEAAGRLAWYKAKNAPGVLAPRNWHCFGTYGSSGATLYVSPEPINSKLLFSSEWKGFRGPAIEISSMNGGTSGRFEVAQKIARLFPAHIDFVRQVIAEGIEPASDFPSGPYPKDKLTYLTRTLVSFETPALSKGLGTDSRLQPNEQAIQGFVFLSMQPNDDAYDISLAIRTPQTSARSPKLLRRALSEISRCFHRKLDIYTPHSRFQSVLSLRNWQRLDRQMYYHWLVMFFSIS